MPMLLSLVKRILLISRRAQPPPGSPVQGRAPTTVTRSSPVATEQWIEIICIAGSGYERLIGVAEGGGAPLRASLLSS